MTLSVSANGDAMQDPDTHTSGGDDLQFRGGLVVKALRLCVSLNSRLESNKEEEEEDLW